MIFIKGDCHFKFSKLNFKNFPEARHLTKDDLVMICGDFGIGPWIGNDRENAYWLDWLEERPFTVAFCDGNHENFDVLDTYPVEMWNGGKVHFIREHVIHLMRGQYYTIEGKTFWVFGGAASHDITDGILEPDDPDFAGKRLELERRAQPELRPALYRINHRTWWAREMPSEEEYAEGVENLAARGNQVDFILTHAASSAMLKKLFGEDGDKEKNKLIAYFDAIESKADYSRWYFGHYHCDADLDEKHTILRDNIVRAGYGAADDMSRAGAFRVGQKVRFLPDLIWGSNKPKNEEGENAEIVGTIVVVDRMGGGVYLGSEPSADILGKNRHLYKHIPFSAIRTMEA